MHEAGEEQIYFCGNSLGLQPKHARSMIERELDAWAELAVSGHFKDEYPWYTYHEYLRESLARLVGAKPHEVVAMNSLTVNLHLMLVTFYRPTSSRYKILMEWPAFPSDIYALKTHLHTRGIDPDDALVLVGPRDHETMHGGVAMQDIETAIHQHADELALVMIGGVNFVTGQVFDMQRITQVAHDVGAIAGFDLAHAAGNIPMQLHDWDVDFAVWCSYKYLNSGPGAIAGCFVHEQHAKNTDLPRYGGWWGNDPNTRFQMHLQPEFVPVQSADAWQISNPPILAMAPLRASLDLFDKAGMDALRGKSQMLTGYLRYLIEQHSADWFEIITPRESEAHGCQLSLLVHDQPRQRFNALQLAGVVCDFREPNVIRAAPVPLYNTFHEVWRFARILTGEV